MHDAEKNLDYKKAKESAMKMIEVQKKLYEISEFLIGKGGFTINGKIIQKAEK